MNSSMPPPPSLSSLCERVQSLASPEKAAQSARFFKTGPGEYGEGDVFLGLTVPEQRKIAKQWAQLPLADVLGLLQHEFHEYRLIALFILIHYYQKAQRENNAEAQTAIYKHYLANRSQVNNWDLVDSSAPYLSGEYLLHHPDLRLILDELARSEGLWDRRIAMISTFAFIRAGEFSDAVRVATILVRDKHDLMHKAVGWMLREIGKRDQATLESFLRQHAPTMPRTMLRYAIERFPEPLRQHYLALR